MSAASIFARSPLLWLLLPFSAGIATAHIGKVPFSFVLAIFSLTSVVLSYLVSKKESTVVWKTLVILALFSAGILRFSIAQRGPSARDDLPSREAQVKLEIKQVFYQDNDRVAGLGSVASSKTHLADLQDENVYFSVQAKQLATEITKGSTIEAIGILSPLAKSNIDTGFSDYLKKRGISRILHRGSVLSLISRPEGIDRFAAVAANWIQEALEAGLDSQASYARTYKAMMLGLKNELLPEQKDAFLKNGAMHLFAVSGLHVGVIAACIHSLLLLIRIPKNWIPIPSLILIALFCVATGGATSTWRATTMIACFYFCQNLRRQPSAINALALSALICLCVSPNQLFMAGFQMSYATVAAILLYGVPLANRVQRIWNPYANLPRQYWGPFREAYVSTLRGILNLACIGFAAFLSSTALGMLYFKIFPSFGLLSNILILPIASLAIIAGFCSIAVSIVGLTSITILFNHAAALLLSFIEGLLRRIASIQGSHIVMDSHHPFLILSFFAIVMAMLTIGYDRRWKWGVKWMLALPVASGMTAFLIASLS